MTATFRLLVTWEVTGTHSIPTCGPIADQRRTSTLLNENISQVMDRHTTYRVPQYLTGSEALAMFLLSAIQPLLPVEGNTCFPNLFEVSRSSNILDGVAVNEDEIGPQPGRDSPTI
jgi:hypothetical protein